MGNRFAPERDAPVRLAVDEISKMNLDKLFFYKWKAAFLIQVYGHVRSFLEMVDTKEEMEFQELADIVKGGKKLLDRCKHKNPLASLEIVEIATLGMNIMKNALDLIISFQTMYSFGDKQCERLWMVTSQLLQTEYRKQDDCLSTDMDQELLKFYLEGSRSRHGHELDRAKLLIAMLNYCFTIRSKGKRVDLSDHWPKVNSDDIKDFKPIGSGSFGSVFQVELYGEQFACKKTDDCQSLIDEANVHFTLHHPNIVRAVCWSEFPNGKFGLVMELMNEANLRDYLDIYYKLVDEKRIKLTVDIICQIADAMDYLHNNNIMHRDLKAQNILVERWPNLTKNQLHVKLGDMGTATHVGIQPAFPYGTPSHMAPELLRGRHGTCEYGLKADVYSFGMTCYEILMGRTLKMVNVDVPDFPDITPFKLKELITDCCKQDPEERPAFDAIVRCTRGLKFGLARVIRSVSGTNKPHICRVVNETTTTLIIREATRAVHGPIRYILQPCCAGDLPAYLNGTFVRYAVLRENSDGIPVAYLGPDIIDYASITFYQKSGEEIKIRKEERE